MISLFYQFTFFCCVVAAELLNTNKLLARLYNDQHCITIQEGINDWNGSLLYISTVSENKEKPASLGVLVVLQFCTLDLCLVWTFWKLVWLMPWKLASKMLKVREFFLHSNNTAAPHCTYNILDCILSKSSYFSFLIIISFSRRLHHYAFFLKKNICVGCV